MDSILKTVKKAVGIDPEYKSAFDDVLIMCINASLANLTQLGVGPITGFSITGANEKWSDFLGDDLRLNLVQSFVCLQTTLLFDPPQNGSLLGAVKEQLKELEWRINVTVDPGGVV